MTEEKKYKWKKWLSISFWTMLGVATIVLLAGAMERKSQRLCKGIDVDIEGVDKIYFVDNTDVINLVKGSYPKMEEMSTESVNLKRLEDKLKMNVWISRAELFFDNNDRLQVKIWEREPIARIITVSGNSFYLDSSGKFIPLSDKFSARVPVFSNFPGEKINNNQDSALIADIRTISNYILKDEFWMAQVSQVDITAAGTFEIIPTVGDHLVVFGDAADHEKKFYRLLTFYKEVLAKTGLNKYSVINVSYDQQVVAVRKDKAARIADSTRAITLMKNLGQSVNRMMMDSIAAATDTTKKLIKDTVFRNPIVANKPVTVNQTISPSKTVPLKTNPVKTNQPISNKPMTKKQ